jgi:hypothetical protein
MKLFALISLLVAGLLGGCATNPPAPAAKTGAATGTPDAVAVKPAVFADLPPMPIVTPDTSLTAKVASYNSEGRYVVLSFPIGQMPKLGQTLFLYRGGLKVAELEVTGPQRDNNIVADLTKGDVQLSDEVRDK